MRLPVMLLGTLAATSLACATAGSGSSGPAVPFRTMTGNLQPTQSRTGSVAVTERQRAYGLVELSVSPNRATRTRVRLNLSAPAQPGVTALRWAIHQGSCGSGSPPVMAVELFPIIELSTGGQGSVDAEIPFELPQSGVYHVNVFRGAGTQLSNVFTCANLRGRS